MGMHVAAVRIGDSMLMLVDENPAWGERIHPDAPYLADRKSTRLNSSH